MALYLRKKPNLQQLFWIYLVIPNMLWIHGFGIRGTAIYRPANRLESWLEPI